METPHFFVGVYFFEILAMIFKGYSNQFLKYVRFNLGVFLSGKHIPMIKTSMVEVKSLEKFIKKQKSSKLIEKLIEPGFVPQGHLAQLVRVSQPDC